MIAKMYDRFLELAGEISDLRSADSLIGWDQETKMPAKGLEGRSQVAATLAAIHHEKQTSPELGDLMRSLASANDLGEVERAQVQELLRVYQRATKLPVPLVRKLAETRSKATAIWAKARGDNDFNSFSPILGDMITLQREMADALGYEGSPYNALMEDYEPGAEVTHIAATFDEVKQFLVPFVQAIQDSGKQPDLTPVLGPYDIDRQSKFGHIVAGAMGFDLEAGRIDVSNHPFCSGIHAGDVRLTTRYKDDLRVGLLGTMHEAGHGLYEQGALGAHGRTPLGNVNSLGIHESQSRLWENNVGLGRSFWTAFYPKLQELFPEHLRAVAFDDFFAAMNDVRPSLIRIEADEVTYNLHVVLRFEIERALIEDGLDVKKLPEVWNGKFQEYFGITPDNDAVGVLQDIHWSMGLVGYFPTYMLGSLNAAQFYATAAKAMPNLEEEIAKGNLIPLRDWLRDNVHVHGSRYLPQELMKVVTGKATSADDFVAYIKQKYGSLYKV